MPLRLPGDLVQLRTERDHLETLLIEGLEDVGYRVVKVPVEGWDDAVEKVGGLYNPQTGKIDQQQYQAATAAYFETFPPEEGIDALAVPFVIVEAVQFDDYSAFWSGTSQNAKSFGSHVLHGLVGISVRGKMRGLSLRFGIDSPEGKKLYLQIAGIELYDRLTAATSVERRPLKDLLKDEERLREAVRMVAEPMRRELSPAQP